MGLDMYLYREIYNTVADWETKTRIITGEQTVTYPNDQTITFNLNDVSKFRVEVGYWRKANAIHKWFIDTCNNGEDKCEDIFVLREQLQTLRNTCQNVIEHSTMVDAPVLAGMSLSADGWERLEVDGQQITNPEYAAERLPTASGFFFGNTEYDDSYIQALNDTIEILDRALAKDVGTFYYRPSW